MKVTDELIESYTAYVTPFEIQQESLAGPEVGNVGTSLSLSVSASVSWTWSWSWT
jgi:hypothetical protein